MTRVIQRRPILGVGIGLRAEHYAYILENLPKVAWFEALSDNYFGDAPGLNQLLSAREHYPMTLHGVGMSLGSTDALNTDYLTKLKQLIKKVEPAYVSDHLSWSSVNNTYLHDLLPLPLTEESVHHVSQRIRQVQDFLDVIYSLKIHLAIFNTLTMKCLSGFSSMKLHNARIAIFY